MRKYTVILFVLFLGVGSACRKIDSKPKYFFDPVSETCVAVIRDYGSPPRVPVAWPVPCPKVKDKLDPLSQEQVEAMLKRIPPENPR